jgi:hypothetical protein
MQQFIKNSARLTGLLLFMLIGIIAQAQEKIEIDTKEVGSWFERNWMWVAAGVLLLLLIVLLGRSRNGSRGETRRTTTVVRDAQGNTKSVTTTEENI